MKRMLRTGISAGVVAATLASIFLLWRRDHECPVQQSDPFACIGWGLPEMATAIFGAWALIAVALRGRGLLHSALGSTFSLLAGLILTAKLAFTVAWLPADSTAQDIGGSFLIGVLVGGFAALWSHIAPAWSGRTTPERESRGGSGDTPARADSR